MNIDLVTKEDLMRFSGKSSKKPIRKAPKKVRTKPKKSK